MKYLDVYRETKGNKDYWLIVMDIDGQDGNPVRAVQFLPVDSLEWRAAEYDIDTADTATLLDIVLAEPHLSEEDWATGHRLHDAPDIATARRDHVARCARAKLRHRINTRTTAAAAATKTKPATPAIPHPCQRIADESPLHPEAIELKRQLVHQARAAHAHAREATPPDRIAALRAAVQRHERGVGE